MMVCQGLQKELPRASQYLVLFEPITLTSLNYLLRALNLIFCTIHTHVPTSMNYDGSDKVVEEEEYEDDDVYLDKNGNPITNVG